MPDTPQIAVPEEIHNNWVTAVLRRFGFTAEESALCARHSAEAARHGQHSHNAIKLCHLLDTLLLPAKMVLPGAKIEPRRCAGALEVWNANRVIGPVAAYQANDRAVELARRQGIGAIAVYNANHFIWGGDYALRAAAAGCIGGNFCQAAKAEVVPYGGVKPALGTNPITIAMPGGILLDMATSAISMGSVQQALREGRQLPPQAALDEAGNPTREPAQARFLLPFGGYKGSSLSMLIELFFSFVGSSLPELRGRETPDGERNTPGFFFFAIDVQALSSGSFAQGRSQEENVRAVAQAIIGSNNEARLPGDSKLRAAALCREQNALLFPPSAIEELLVLAQQYGVPFPAGKLREVR